MRYFPFFGIILIAVAVMYSIPGCMGAQGSPRAQVPIKIAKPKPLPPERERPDIDLEVVEKVRLFEEENDISIHIDSAGKVYVMSFGPGGSWLCIREGKEWGTAKILRPLPNREILSGFVDGNGQFFICFIRRKRITPIKIEFYPVSPELWDTSLPKPRPSEVIEIDLTGAWDIYWVRGFPGLPQRLLLVGTYDQHNPPWWFCLTRMQRIRTALVKDGVVQKSQRVTPHGPFSLYGLPSLYRDEPLPLGLFPDGTAFMALLKGYIHGSVPPPEHRLYLAYFDGERWHGCDAVYLPDVGKGTLSRRGSMQPYPYQVVPHGTKVLVFFGTVPETAVIQFDPRILKGISKASKPLVLTPTELGDPYSYLIKALADKEGNISVLMENEDGLVLIRRVEGQWSRPLALTEHPGLAGMAIGPAGNQHIIWTEKGQVYYCLLAPKRQHIAAPATP